GRPRLRDRRREIGRAVEPPTARTVGTDEVGVTELADGAVPVAFSTRPEVAACEPAEHCWPARLSALPLQRVEDLLDPVHPRSPTRKRQHRIDQPWLGAAASA